MTAEFTMPFDSLLNGVRKNVNSVKSLFAWKKFNYLPEARDTVTQPMKFVSFVPKTIPGSNQLFPV